VKRLSRRKNKKIWRAIAVIVVGVVCIVYLFPLFWLVLNTLKTKVQIFDTVPKFIFKPTIANYRTVLSSGLFGKSFRMSVLMTLSSTLLTLLLGTTAGYVLSRFRMKLKNDLMFFILLTRMIPPIVTIIPIYTLYLNIGLQDTFFGLVLIYTNFNLAFSVWMMKGFIDNVPYVIEEAAMCDGYTRLAIFFKLLVPLVIPGLLATAVFCGIFTWNEFLFALVLSRSKIILLPVQIYSASFFAPGIISTISLLFVLPVIIFTYMVRKHLLQGITFGIMKGNF
jgi:multiple sugar transport system permease protein